MTTPEILHSAAPIKLGAFTLNPQFHEGHFTGLGEISHGATPLRSSSLPWTFYTESEKGVRFNHFDLTGIEQSEKQATLVFRSEGEWLPRLQQADAMGDARVQTRRVQPPVAEFRWTFRLIREKIQENEFDGLAMQIEIASPGHPIHWLIEDTTWEIGGAAEGATLIQQDISTMDLEQTVRKDNAFSTIEKFFTDGWGGAYPMDMLPRAAGSAILDFQVKDDVALCVFAEKPSLTRARLEKFADENVIHYLDRPFFALTENAKAPERKLLVYRHPQKLKRHEWRNLWVDCFTEVRLRILKPYDFKVELPVPGVSAHLWDADLKKYMANWGDDLRNALPKLKELGYKQVFTHGVWDSITSDPNPPAPGNICCPYQFKFAESFGGAAGMKKLSEAAEQSGEQLFQWFSFHLSKYAKVWKDHPDWVLREANGDPWDAAYDALWAGRIRSEYGKWWTDQILETCREAGLHGIFWDSYQNLGVTCVDWGAPDKAPQAEEIWRFQAELQKRGVAQRCEIVTIFGVSAVATYGFEDDKFRRRLWADTLKNDDIFAQLDCSPGFFSKQYSYAKGRISPEVYFWMVAHRVVPHPGMRPWEKRPEDAEHGAPSLPGGELAAEYGRVNHIYNEVLPRMHRLRLVEGATHTLWLDEANKPSVVWAFKTTQVAHSGAAREVGSGRQVDAAGKLDVQPGEVWLLG